MGQANGKRKIMSLLGIIASSVVGLVVLYLMVMHEMHFIAFLVPIGMVFGPLLIFVVLHGGLRDQESNDRTRHGM